MLITKVTVNEPAGTVTELGTIEVALLDPNATTVPPAGARPLRFTVPAELEPPISAEGERDTLVKDAGLMVRLPD